MKKSLIAMSVLVLVATLAAGTVFAGGHRGRGGPGMKAGQQHGFGAFGRLGMLKEKLDLSDPQTDRIKAIFAELRDKNEPYRDQLRDGRESIAASLIAHPDDMAVAQALIDRQSTAERAMKSNMLNATAQALKVLTPQQRAKLGELMAERHARAAEHRERREGRNHR